MKALTESRKYKRIETRIPIKYKKLKDFAGHAKASTLTGNISEGGVLLGTTEFISKACKIVMEIDLPMFAKPVKAISKVAWIRKKPTGDYYEVGGQFLEISANDKKQVIEYISSLSAI